MNYWVVRADWDGEDKTPEFLEKGIWESGYKDYYTSLIQEISIGDRIAIKAVFKRKQNLPFDNHGCLVGCMTVKAIGTVTENTGNGKLLKVNWEPQLEQDRIIYLYAYSPAVIRVANRKAQKYIFDNAEQDYVELEQFYKKRSESRKEKLSDDFILSQFRDISNFEYIENNIEYKELFLRFARYIHATPMDWWITYSDQTHPVRFGVNNNFNGRNSTNGYVAAVGFDKEGIFYKPNDLAYFTDETELVRLTQEKLEELEEIDFAKMDNDRDPFIGYWPENYKGTEQKENMSHHSDGNTPALNRILFGAAGTGKTYHAITHALSIIENKTLEELENENREALKKRFDDYKAQGQIRFVTFHQSFSYEDFVEGIRAETNSEGQLSYEVKPGVFKEVCNIASLNLNRKTKRLIGPIDFGRGYKLLKLTEDVLEIQKPNGNIFHLSKNLGDYLLQAYRNKAITLQNISNKEVIEILGNHPLLEPYLVNGYNTVWANLIPILDEYYEPETDSIEKVPYVLIIDEINRGNISRIFGELITLIEDSKRAGAEESLSITLPYSKEEFSVPDNVYIIGTMNSSDRSLTGLDIALRRRFTFIEMPPKPELLKDVYVGGVDIQQLLTVINQRIEVLLDRDHCIGHANFMSLKEKPTLSNLVCIFKQKIIPQLQEYFFDDWSKINMVLNANGILKPKALERSSLFPNVDSESEGFFEEQRTWELVESAFDSLDSFANIIKH